MVKTTLRLALGLALAAGGCASSLRPSDTASPLLPGGSKGQHSAVECGEGHLMSGKPVEVVEGFRPAEEAQAYWCIDSSERHHGPYRVVKSDGAVLVDGSFAGGNPDGKWRIFSESGVLAESGRFADGRLEGEWISWSPDGSKSSSSMFESGVRHGKTEVWHRSRRIALRQHFRRGVLTEWHAWNREGDLIGVGAYDTSSRRMVETWYKNGRKAAQYHLRDGVRDGPYKTWFPNGEPARVGAFKDGVELEPRSYSGPDPGSGRSPGAMADE